MAPKPVTTTRRMTDVTFGEFEARELFERQIWMAVKVRIARLKNDGTRLGAELRRLTGLIMRTVPTVSVVCVKTNALPTCEEVVLL